MPDHSLPVAAPAPVEPVPVEPPAHIVARRPPGVLETAACILLYFLLQGGVGALFFWLTKRIFTQLPWWPDARGDRIILVVVPTLLISAALVTSLLMKRWKPWADARGPVGLGLTPSTGRFFAVGAAIGLLCPIVGGMLTQFLAGDHVVSQSVTELADSAHIGMRLLLLPVAVLIGPFVEEVLFRGALLSVLRSRIGDGWGIAVSATIFALVHLPDLDWLWYALPNLALVGVGCAWLRVRSGSLGPAYIAHAVNNGLATLGWFAR